MALNGKSIAVFAWAKSGPNPPKWLGQAGPRLGQIWATNSQGIENTRTFGVDHKHNPQYPSNALVLQRKTGLQRQLRMVCAFLSPGRAKPQRGLAALPLLESRPSPFGRVFGIAVSVVILAVTPALSDGWSNAASSAGWSSADRFVAETPRTNNRSPSVPFNAFLASLKGGELDKLMSLISRVESPRLGYDSVQYRARVKPAQRPTQMTLGAIFSWIKATPGQQHAIGRYQVIPSTLAYVSRELGFKSSTRYNRATQDKIATFLIMEAGYDDFRKGRISRSKFMDNLAAVWAGFPLKNGRSKYAGIAGNKATITRAQFERAMGQIFPVRRAEG